MRLILGRLQVKIMGNVFSFFCEMLCSVAIKMEQSGRKFPRLSKMEYEVAYICRGLLILCSLG